MVDAEVLARLASGLGGQGGWHGRSSQYATVDTWKAAPFPPSARSALEIEDRAELWRCLSYKAINNDFCTTRSMVERSLRSVTWPA